MGFWRTFLFMLHGMNRNGEEPGENIFTYKQTPSPQPAAMLQEADTCMQLPLY